MAAEALTSVTLQAGGLNHACYFSVAGKAIFGRSQSNGSLLQSINTPSAQYLISLRRERLQIDPQFQEGMVARMPWPDLGEEAQIALGNLGERNARVVSEVLAFDETTHLFNGVIDEAAFLAATQDADSRIRDSEAEADTIMAKLLGLAEMDRCFIDREILPRWHGRSKANWYSYVSGKDEASFAVGTAFGRWDIRFFKGEQEPAHLRNPFEQLPVCSPGMLCDRQGYPAKPEDIPEKYPASVAWNGILVDEPGNDWDIVELVRAIWRLRGETAAEEVEASICESSHVSNLRDYFRKSKGFFADHLTRYSKIGRRSPIYWPLATASATYTIWIYYPRLSGQTLYIAINDFLEPKLKEVRSDAAALLLKGGSRSRLEEKKFESVQTLEQELIELRDSLLQLAESFAPDHDDGVQITAAPLWSLFRHKQWQKILKDTWKKLEKGDYDWAHLAMNYWPDRVREKCKTDKSLAIAHGLEDLYEEPEAKPKKTCGRRKARGGE